MHCYVCDDEGQATPAVALCKHCGVALCRAHLDEELANAGPGGTDLTCSHEPTSKVQQD